MPPGTGEVVAAAINAGKPLATHAEGWSTTSVGVWAGVCTIVPLLITAMVKLLPVMRKLAMEREASLDDERRGDMSGMRRRIEQLEQALTSLNEAREADRVRHEAEVSILRHGLGNAEACLDAMLLLIEAAPEKAPEHAGKVRRMREEMRERLDAEKRSFAAAKIIAAAPAAGPPATT
jgi:uncharacterized membrane protein YhiD involved in acid resistance